MGLLKYVVNEASARLGVMMPESLEREEVSGCGGVGVLLGNSLAIEKPSYAQKYRGQEGLGQPLWSSRHDGGAERMLWDWGAVESQELSRWCV